MQKILLLSIVLALVAIPARAAHIKNSRVGLKKALINSILYNLFYVFAVLYIYPRLG